MRFPVTTIVMGDVAQLRFALQKGQRQGYILNFSGQYQQGGKNATEGCDETEKIFRQIHNKTKLVTKAGE